MINTKPELQILADDVRCTHGATVGQLDEEALFYLRTRGIDKTDARDLLIYAFARDVIDRIGIASVREYLEKALFESLTHSRQSAEACVMSAHAQLLAEHGSSSTSIGFGKTFPFCKRRFTAKPLVYLDNAATSQKPQGGHRCAG